MIPGLAGDLDDHAAAAVSDYVAGGGRLLLTDTLVRDRAGKLRGMRPSLEALFELTAGGDAARALYAVSRAAPTLLPLDCEFRSVTTRAPVLVTDAAAEESPTPEEFATVRPGPHPLVVQAARGRGTATYCAFPLGGAIWSLPHVDLLDLLRDLAAPAGAEDVALRTSAPGCVAFTLARFSGGRLLHLVSSAGVAPLAEPVRLGPFDVRLPGPRPPGATLFAPGEEAVPLRTVASGGGFTLNIPGLAQYGLVVMEDGPARRPRRGGSAG